MQDKIQDKNKRIELLETGGIASLISAHIRFAQAAILQDNLALARDEIAVAFMNIERRQPAVKPPQEKALHFYAIALLLLDQDYQVKDIKDRHKELDEMVRLSGFDLSQNDGKQYNLTKETLTNLTIHSSQFESILTYCYNQEKLKLDRNHLVGKLNKANNEILKANSIKKKKIIFTNALKFLDVLLDENYLPVGDEDKTIYQTPHMQAALLPLYLSKIKFTLASLSGKNKYTRDKRIKKLNTCFEVIGFLKTWQHASRGSIIQSESELANKTVDVINNYQAHWISGYVSKVDKNDPDKVATVITKFQEHIALLDKLDDCMVSEKHLNTFHHTLATAHEKIADLLLHPIDNDAKTDQQQLKIFRKLSVEALVEQYSKLSEVKLSYQKALAESKKCPDQNNSDTCIGELEKSIAYVGEELAGIAIFLSTQKLKDNKAKEYYFSESTRLYKSALKLYNSIYEQYKGKSLEEISALSTYEQEEYGISLMMIGYINSKLGKYCRDNQMKMSYLESAIEYLKHYLKEFETLRKKNKELLKTHDQNVQYLKDAITTLWDYQFIACEKALSANQNEQFVKSYINLLSRAQQFQEESIALDKIIRFTKKLVSIGQDDLAIQAHRFLMAIGYDKKICLNNIILIYQEKLNQLTNPQGGNDNYQLREQLREQMLEFKKPLDLLHQFDNVLLQDDKTYQRFLGSLNENDNESFWLHLLVTCQDGNVLNKVNPTILYDVIKKIRRAGEDLPSNILFRRKDNKKFIINVTDALPQLELVAAQKGCLDAAISICSSWIKQKRIKKATKLIQELLLRNNYNAKDKFKIKELLYSVFDYAQESETFKFQRTVVTIDLTCKKISNLTEDLWKQIFERLEKTNVEIILLTNKQNNSMIKSLKESHKKVKVTLCDIKKLDDRLSPLKNSDCPYERCLFVGNAPRKSVINGAGIIKFLQASSTPNTTASKIVNRVILLSLGFHQLVTDDLNTAKTSSVSLVRPVVLQNRFIFDFNSNSDSTQSPSKRSKNYSSGEKPPPSPDGKF